MAKLTEAQRSDLQGIADQQPGGFWRAHTAPRLLKAGLIELVGVASGYRSVKRYRITDAGRAVLKEQS